MGLAARGTGLNMLGVENNVGGTGPKQSLIEQDLADQKLQCLCFCPEDQISGRFYCTSQERRKLDIYIYARTE